MMCVYCIIAGGVYVDGGSTTSSGGEVAFAYNSAAYGGTSATERTLPYLRYSITLVSPGGNLKRVSVSCRPNIYKQTIP